MQALEDRFEIAKQELIARLKERGGDPSRRFQAMGYEVVRVASNEGKGGWDALIFHVDGSWSIKFAMDGYPLTNPSLNEILKEYGKLEDPRLRMIYLGQMARPSKTLEEHQGNEQNLLTYVRENRRQLLEGLIRNIEKVTQGLHGQAETS